jgi:hypothetical protein
VTGVGALIIAPARRFLVIALAASAPANAALRFGIALWEHLEICRQSASIGVSVA